MAFQISDLAFLQSKTFIINMERLDANGEVDTDVEFISVEVTINNGTLKDVVVRDTHHCDSPQEITAMEAMVREAFLNGKINLPCHISFDPFKTEQSIAADYMCAHD